MTEVGRVDLKVRLDKSGLKQDQAQLQQDLASLKDVQIPVGFKVDAQGKLRDELGRYVKGGLAGLGKDGGIDISVRADTDPIKSELTGLKRFADNIATGIGLGIGQRIVDGAVGTLRAGVGAIVGTAQDGLAVYRQFSEQITTFGALSGGTAEEVKALSDEAKRLGLETSKTPVEAAKAAVELTKLGFSAKDTKAQLSGLVSLDEASGLNNLEKAASIAGAAFNIFGISTQRVADVVAATANATAAGAEDFLQVISEAGGVAKANAQDFETLSAAFGLLRQSGASAAVAATAVKTLIQRLGAPGSKESADAIAEIGVQIRNTDGSMRNILDLIPEFRAALQNIDPQRKATLVRTIFGDEGAPSFLNLLETSQQKIDEVRKTINNSEGSAGDAAKKLLQGYAGQLKILEGSIETLKLNFGEAIAPAFEGAAKGANNVVSSLLKNQDLFGSLQASAKEFGDTLADPSITEPIAKGLEDVVGVLSGEATKAVQEFASYLKENPEAIAQMAKGLTSVVSLLVQAVGKAAELAGLLANGGQGLGDSLSPGGTEGAGSRRALTQAGGTSANQEAVAKRVQERLEKEGFAGGNKLFGYNRRIEGEFFQEETAKEIEKVAAQNRQNQANAARFDATVGKQQTGGDAKAEAGTKPADTKKATGTSPGAAPKDFVTEFKQREAAIDDRRTQALIDAGGGGATETAQADLQAAKEKIALKNEELAKVEELKSKRLVSEKDAATRELSIRRELRQEKLKEAQLESKQLQDESERRIKREAAAIDLADVKAQTDVKSGELSGKYKGLDGEIKQTEDAEKFANQRLALKEKEIGEIQALRARGAIGEKEAEDKLLAATKEAAQARLKVVETRIQRGLKLVEDIERKTRIAETRIDIGTTDRTTALRRNQLAGRIQGEGGQTEILKFEEQALIQKEALKRKELARIQELQQKKLISEKVATDKSLAIEQQLSQTRAKLTDIATQRELKAIQAKTDAQKRASDAIVANLNREKAVNDARIASLERQTQLLDSQKGLAQARADARTSGLKIREDQTTEAIDLFKQAQDADPASVLGATLRQQLGGLGTSAPAQGAGDVANAQALLGLIQQRAALQAEADREKIAALLQSQELERKSEELGLQKQAISAKNNVLEAERAELLAKQNAVEAEGNLLKAQKTGDKNDIANAQSAVDLAKQGIDLAGQQISQARESLAVQDQLKANAQETLAIKQQTARAEQEATNAANQRARDREVAGAKDAATGMGKGSKGGGAGGVGGLGAGAGQTAGSYTGERLASYRDADRKIEDIIRSGRGTEAIQQDLVRSLLTVTRAGDREALISRAAEQGFGDLLSKVDKLQQGGVGADKIQQAIQAAQTGKTDLSQQFDKLLAAIDRLSNNPRSISVQSPDPIGNLGQILNAVGGNRLGGSRL